MRKARRDWGKRQVIMRANPERYRAAKLSMLDHDLEVRLRRDLLERDQILFTGDDHAIRAASSCWLMRERVYK